MDVEAIAKRIAQDHGITVLEKDVIETLEKLKTANKDKTTSPVTNATTDVAKDPEHAASVNAQLKEQVKQPNTDPAHVTEQQIGGAASVIGNAASTPPTIPPVAASVNAQLPADPPSILAAFQQFLAAYKQAPNTIPTASEQPNESDSIYDVDNNRRVLRV